jgi:regulator of cell morphogenesis and NO signaling
MQQHKFTAQSRMSELINEDVTILSSISRFGISLGFGHITVQEACERNNIHCETFLAIVNFLSEGGNVEFIENYKHLSLETVINYLKNAHSFFLEYKLPAIRTQLIEAVESTGKGNKYSDVFLKFFNEYFEEVRKHMGYEEQVVFPYVLNLINGDYKGKYRIADFEKQHSDVDSKLAELKNILIKYYPAEGVNYLLNDVLFDLLWCEKDLSNHNQVEDYFFVPVIEAIERKQNTSK